VDKRAAKERRREEARSRAEVQQAANNGNQGQGMMGGQRRTYSNEASMDREMERRPNNAKGRTKLI
jgi:hypothetical protein